MDDDGRWYLMYVFGEGYTCDHLLYGGVLTATTEERR